MRKLTCFLLLLLTLISTARATDYVLKQRHIPGKQAYTFLPGMSPNGKSFELSYSRFCPRGFMYSFLFTPSIGDVKQTSYTRYFVGFRPQFTLLNYRHNFFLSSFCTAYSGFEFLKNYNLGKKDRGPLLNLGVGLEAEYCVDDAFSIVSHFEQNYHLVSKMGEYTYNLRIGVRYAF